MWESVRARTYSVNHSESQPALPLVWFLWNLWNVYFSSDISKWGNSDMIEAQISMGQCPPTFYSAILDNLYGGNGEISALAQSNLNRSVGKKANFGAASSSLSFPGENASLKGIVTRTQRTRAGKCQKCWKKSGRCRPMGNWVPESLGQIHAVHDLILIWYVFSQWNLKHLKQEFQQN